MASSDNLKKFLSVIIEAVESFDTLDGHRDEIHEAVVLAIMENFAAETIFYPSYIDSVSAIVRAVSLCGYAPFYADFHREISKLKGREKKTEYHRITKGRWSAHTINAALRINEWLRIGQ